ncbi:hypothetical protein [Methylobacterium nodulans]|nr:hypothetical protein [Methylobacterium nodulans]
MSHDDEALISPSAAATTLGLNRSTLCRQIRSGHIPTHDGKVRLSEVRKARAENLKQPRGGPRKGAAPSRMQHHDPVAAAVLAVLRHHARIVATSVLEAGGSLEVAFAASRIAHSPFLEAARLALGDEEGVLVSLPADQVIEPDWSALAKAADVSCDPAALRAYLNGLPVWSDSGTSHFECAATCSA